jgi:uncharacterized OB-fold protein
MTTTDSEVGAGAGGGPYYLPQLARPEASRNGLEAPFWEATERDELVVQRCSSCGTYQWGPEWICHACHSFEVGFEPVERRGRIYSWERVWHPVHQLLVDACPYIIALVELPHAGNVRMLGNLLGDPRQDVVIGTDVDAVFEHHDGYTLVQWQTR